MSGYADLRALSVRLGRTPMMKDWRETGKRPKPTTITVNYGRWPEVLRKAGLA